MMTFKILFTIQASKDLKELENNKSLEKSLKAVRKTLAYLQTDPRHPSLNIHKYKSIKEIMEKKYLRHMLKIILLLLL